MAFIATSTGSIFFVDTDSKLRVSSRFPQNSPRCWDSYWSAQ